MKKLFSTLAAALLLASCGNLGAERRLSHAPELKTQTDTLSWAYGQNIASVLRDGYFSNLDADLIMQSARYTLDGGTDQPLTPEEIKNALDFIMMNYAVTQREDAAAERVECDRKIVRKAEGSQVTGDMKDLSGGGRFILRDDGDHFPGRMLFLRPRPLRRV